MVELILHSKVGDLLEVCKGPGQVQTIAIKCYVEHFGLSRAILFSQKKLFVVALILCS
jgi:hypothetical protein